MLCFTGDTLTESRNGLVVHANLAQADGHSERREAIGMIDRHSPGSTPPLTLGAGFVADLRQRCVTSHVARKARHSALDGGTTRHAGYAASHTRGKKIEDPFGWAKTIGGMATTAARSRTSSRSVSIAACESRISFGRAVRL